MNEINPSNRLQLNILYDIIVSFFTPINYSKLIKILLLISNLCERIKIVAAGMVG